MKRFREWLIGTYNGLYKIVLEPYMPSRQTVLILVLAFIFGLIWAYALSPTVYYNGDPSQLDQSWQNEWVVNVAARYERAQASGIPSEELRQQIVRLLAAVDNPLSIATAQGITDPDFLSLAQQAEPGKAAPAQPSLIGNLMPFIIGSIVVTVLTVVIALLGRILIYPNIIEPQIRRMRGGVAASDHATQTTMDAIRKAKAAEIKAKETAIVDDHLGAPIVRRMSVYILGRGEYDDQIEIADANDSYIGQAGATIAETVGGDSPEKVNAIEVWVNDREDFVRIVSAFFVTEAAYNDPMIRSRLEPRGQVIMVTPGGTAVLDTGLLKLQARIVEFSYGDGPLPPSSYFENMTIEIAAWLKDGKSSPPAPVPAMPAMAPMHDDDSTAAFIAPPPGLPQQQAAYQPVDTPPPPPPSSLPPLRQEDDDPFGGTADFTPINRN